MTRMRYTKGCNALARLIPRCGGWERVDMVEVGVYDGATSQGLLHRFPDLHLTMVDPWLPYSDKEWAKPDWAEIKRQALERTEFAADRRRILHCTSASAAPSVPRWSQDIVFIDGDHSYDAVRLDIRLWWPKVKPGGLLTGHDYEHRNFRGVRRAVDEWAARWGLEVRPRWDFSDEDWDALLRARIWWVRKGEAK